MPAINVCGRCVWSMHVAIVCVVNARELWRCFVAGVRIRYVCMHVVSMILAHNYFLFLKIDFMTSS